MEQPKDVAAEEEERNEEAEGEQEFAYKDATSTLRIDTSKDGEEDG